MKYILPIAGEGSRFTKVGIQTPKPLIKILGQPLLLYSMEGLPIGTNDEIIIITQKKHEVKKNLSSRISSKYRGTKLTWIEIDYLTEGQLSSVLLAKSLIDSDEGVVIHNCDTSFRSGLAGLIVDAAVDGALTCVKAAGENWSFAKIDDQDNVIETAEKVRISEWASVGLYYFKSGKRFLKYAEDAVQKKEKTKNEYYVAPLYNKLVKDSLKIKIDRTIAFKPMGTPEDLKEYWGIELEELKKENNMMSTIVLDLDGTICEIKTHRQHYSEVAPKKLIVDKINEYKKLGFRIIIYTARNMQTYENNVGAIIANVAETTIKWLKDNKIPFDELIFGKPWGRNVFYVDDKAIRPDEFLNLSYEEILRLTES